MTRRPAGLRLSDDLVLPVDAVTEPIGLFANRGKGKSNAAHRFVEQLYHADLPSIVLDIKGDWFGIRSSADGTSPGLPFPIFGGSHGDVPLEPGSGTDVARFLAEQRVPTIIDLSHLSKTQARRWVMEFAEELYRVNTDPLMLVVDEADVLIPQRLAAELMRLLGAMEDIAKRGRQRGLGVTIVSQRVADVNKSVTDLLETLFLFAVTGSRTRKALLEWIDDHADPEEAKAVIATLSSLEPGECWVWSPGWLRLLKRLRFLRPETFDSHATPKAGETRRSIRTMAELDLSAIKEQMAETFERAKADDPTELRRRIAALERELAKRDATMTPPPPVPVVEEVEVPVFSEDLVVRLERALEPCAVVLSEVQERLSWEATQRDKAVEFKRRLASPPAAPPAPEPEPRQRARPESEVVGDAGDAGELPKGERVTLVAIAQHSDGISREHATILTGFKRSTRDAYIQRLRSRELVTVSDGRVCATDAGRMVLGPRFKPLPTGAALRAHWLAELPEGESRVLAELVDAYPDGVDREHLSAVTGYKRSTRDAYLQRLRVRGLVSTAGKPTASALLFG